MEILALCNGVLYLTKELKNDYAAKSIPGLEAPALAARKSACLGTLEYSYNNTADPMH